MTQTLTLSALTAQAFAPFGDVLDVSGTPDKIINQGLCGRHHDRARLDFGDGRAGISLFNAEPRQFPIKLDMVERHPEGPGLYPDEPAPLCRRGRPRRGWQTRHPRAFVTSAGQAINLHRGTWHGVLTPIHAPGLFAVVDRIGEGANLEEHWFETGYEIVQGAQSR